MTENQYTVRCRRRHKTNGNRMESEESDSEEMDVEEYPPSTSSSSHHHHHHWSSEDVDSEVPRRIPRMLSDRISIGDVSNVVTVTDNDISTTDTTTKMRRRRIVRTSRTRRRMTSDNEVKSSSATPLPVPSFNFPQLSTSTTRFLLFLVLCAILKPCLSIPELRCGPIDIRNKPWQFRQQWSHLGDPHAVNYYINKSASPTWPPKNVQINCTVVEGSFSISFVYDTQQQHKKNTSDEKILEMTDYPRFPHLREITGSLLIFETTALTDLGYIFPNLRVIGGQSLIQHYALIIYRNSDLDAINLSKLSVIRNGGVRIQDNKVCCHVKSIDWKAMVMTSINDVVVDDAAENSVTETGKLCPKGPCEPDPDETRCRYIDSAKSRIQSCWSNTTCHKVCQWDRLDNQEMGPGCDPDGNKCHDQCLGGCDRPNDPTACSACRFLHYKGKCVEKCESHLYVLMNRRCVTKRQCLELNPVHQNKTVPIKATDGLCSDKCPEGWEIDPNNPRECKRCDGVCEIKCPLDHKIDTFPKALAISKCNIIDGDLTIEMRGKQESGMAAALKEVFTNIHTITGHLKIVRSPPFLSLSMFRNLRVVEARTLFLDKYAIAVVENPNLRKLFDERSNFTIGNGTVQIHNNRMLCYSNVRNLVHRLGVELNEDDQSVDSNGDKAICEDARIEVRVVSVAFDIIVLEWDVFNTSDIDHRKFLGYELYYKEVPKIDYSMSIDEDRSACVDSWSSVFQQHYEKDHQIPGEKVTVQLGPSQKIRANTVYAYYVATQMVHHPGAKNGLSKIGFVTTLFSQPEPPTMTVTRVETDSIMLVWEPPRNPNGNITHYMISWRELDIRVHDLANIFCQKDAFEKSLQLTRDSASMEADEKTYKVKDYSFAPTLTSLIAPTEETCQAAGCCVCSGETDPKPIDEDATVETSSFENELMDTIITPRSEIRSRRSIKNLEEMDKKLEQDQKNRVQMGTSTVKPSKKPLIYVDSKKRKGTTTTPSPSATPNGSPIHYEAPVIHDALMEVKGKFSINVTAKASGNMFMIKNLKHFTTYGITVAACQDIKVQDSHCSLAYKAGTKKRTKPLLNIDKVDNSTIRVVSQENVKNVNVTWDEPKETNGGIIGYHVIMNSTTGSTPMSMCVGAKKDYNSSTTGVQFIGMNDGRYEVYIIATSPYRQGEAVVWSGPLIIESPGWFQLWMIGVIFLVILAIAAIAAFISRKIMKERLGKRVKALADFMHLNPEYAVDNTYTADYWELKADDVTIGSQCGEGSFGKVYLGTGNNVTTVHGDIFGPCAIKINNENLESGENLNYLMEANVMKNFKTAFIVKLYGVISSKTPAMVVMEVMELGNLRDYLRSKRQDDVFNEMECDFYDVVPREKFCEWAAQICDGMAYLESLKFCHRDLAARNCMINANETVKIGDFGMARDLFYHDYYKPSGKRMMPVRWMSPESLKDGKFDSKSDIWSFGVVLYEMVTLGAQPYIGLSNDEVLNYIGMARKVIKQPECCSDYWYKIMKMCWRFAPRDRPTFLQLVHLLSAEASDGFKQASFVLTENQMAMEDAEPLDLDEIYNYEPEPDEDDIEAMDHLDSEVENGERRHTDSIPMKEFRSDHLDSSGMNSRSTISVGSGGPHTGRLRKSRQRSLDDEYALMNHSRGPSDTEVRHYGVDDGDYVERDVPQDMPTRRNTGASTNSYAAGPYCLTNRGGSNERAGFGEGLRLTDALGSGHLHSDDNDYVEKEISSMDTRRSTGASTASYGAPQPTQPTNWSGSRGATYYANRQQQQQQAAAAAAAAVQNRTHAQLNEGRGDRLTQLPGTGHLQNKDEGDYIVTEPRNTKNDGSPSKNGNTSSNRASSNGRSLFGEKERLIEDNEHPLS